MNIAAALSASLDLLRGGEQWPNRFDITPRGVGRSFLAVLLTLPCYYMGALAAQQERAEILGLAGREAVAWEPFFFIFGLYALCFSGFAYGTSRLLGRMDIFNLWIVSRHWTVLLLMLVIGFFSTLSLVGAFPYGWVVIIGLFIWVSIFLTDIYLIYRLLNLGWIWTILLPCMIQGLGFAILLAGILKFMTEDI